MQDFLDAIESGASSDDIAAIPIPESYRAAHVLRSEAGMFEGVDSPELRTKPGKLAATWARSLLPPGTNVTVQSCRWEKYGRILGRIQLATGDDYATELLAAGYAQPYDGHGPR